MSKNINICPECGTENEPQYTYCKNCGTALAVEGGAQENNKGSNFNHSTNDNPKYDNFAGRRTQENSGYTAYDYSQPPFIIDTIDGNPTDDVITFTGKNAMKFVPKFSKMELSGSRVSWCWPVALLGYMFGPLGAAIWFFYRKMYKIALILVAIGVLLGGANAVIDGYVSGIAGPVYEESFEQFIEGQNGYFDFLLDEYDALEYSPVYSLIEGVISLATMLLGGLFSMHFYKKHIAQQISIYRASNIDPRYYQLGLASIGGTSSGMAWLGILILIITTNIFDAISSVIQNLFI